MCPFTMRIVQFVIATRLPPVEAAKKLCSSEADTYTGEIQRSAFVQIGSAHVLTSTGTQFRIRRCHIEEDDRLRRSFFPHYIWQLDGFDLLREAEHFESPDSIPVHVDFVPLQAVTGRSGMGMMIVVPAFPEGQ
jgi:hypothetical protein